MTTIVQGMQQAVASVDTDKIHDCVGEIQGWTLTPISITHALGGLTRSIKGIVEPFFEIAGKVSAGIGGTQFTAALLLPFGLYELACEVGGLFKKETIEGKVDSVLNVIGGIGDGLDGVASISEGLASVGAVSCEAVAWAGPLGMAAAGISVIFIAVHAKAIHNNRKALKGLKKAKSDLKQIDPYALIAKLTLKKYRFESGSDIDVEQVINKINLVKDQVNADAKVKEIYKGLKTRIKEKQACHALGIVITVVGIVAGAILFATALTPWAIAAFALLGGLYLLCISKMAVSINSDRKFNQLVA